MRGQAALLDGTVVGITVQVMVGQAAPVGIQDGGKLREPWFKKSHVSSLVQRK